MESHREALKRTQHRKLTQSNRRRWQSESLAQNKRGTKVELWHSSKPRKKPHNYYYNGLCQDILSFRSLSVRDYLVFQLCVKRLGREAEHPACLSEVFSSCSDWSETLFLIDVNILWLCFSPNRTLKVTGCIAACYAVENNNFPEALSRKQMV